MNLLLTLIVAVSLGQTQPPKETKDELTAIDLKRHEGYWAVDSFIYDGQPASEDVVKSITREVDGEHITWKRDGKPFSGSTLQINPNKSPKTITVVPEGGQAQDKPVLGIYKLDGDNLTICMARVGDPAPKTFVADKGSHYTLIKLHRVQEPAKRPKKR